MSKKPKILFIGLLVAVLLLGIWYYFAALRVPVAVKAPVSPSKASSSFSVPHEPITVNPANNTPMTPQQMRAAADAEANREKSIWNFAFMTPIAFYGKVVDEKGNPIEGAKAVLSPADAMMGGNHEYERTTDENGLFSIFTHGLGLAVDVSKKGYYTLQESSGTFGYAKGSGAQPPHNDPNNPAIFILKKMGETEPLIMAHYQGKIEKDGTPVQMNLTTGHTYHEANPDIQIRSWVKDQDPTKAFDWNCEIDVLGGGGIQAEKGGPFDFTAPVGGYQPSATIAMPAANPQWRSSQDRKYFLKLANGTYARIDFAIGAGGYNTIEISSYLNPSSGHRNLEYSPKQ